MDIDFGSRVGQLPFELAQVLNQTYFLHLLATEPETVIPDGKSLLSMMVHSRLKPQTARLSHLAQLRTNFLFNRLRKRSFHCTKGLRKPSMGLFGIRYALEALSDPTPSVQIDRLKGLLLDVREAISPLFPKNHSIITTLSAPLPPTASPLISTNLLLKEILVALRQRAAPSTTSQLARLVINTMKSIMALADTMKADLNQFVLGSMTETQLRDIVVQQAAKREKEVVLDIWGDSGKDGTERVQTLWQTWVDELEGERPSEPRDIWIRRLVQSLGSTKAVSCTMPDLNEELAHDHNRLPPQFFFAAPRLLYAQNYLQALVVAASLRSLTRLPPLSQSDSRGHDFMDRIWTLLKAEIDEEDASASTTKIINFADEVVRARRLVSVPDEREEAQLRAAVDRTLQYGDPVFLLLQKRLLAALADQLCRPRVTPDGVVNHAPERMQTGRTLGNGRADKRPRLEADAEHSLAVAMTPVKGFEDPVLVHGINEILTKVHKHIRWVDNVWFDLS
ncbi:hypothetical protein MVEN_00526400 [Mycena venus]|uniref:Uncharacterized protein n=1 Tax=Mycena venus TaxID=2733690 RepID=A0A8H6YP63_9AGAR|nr:hypothetical protein MVEN_00526400 [Mycena venus]